MKPYFILFVFFLTISIFTVSIHGGFFSSIAHAFKKIGHNVEDAGKHVGGIAQKSFKVVSKVVTSKQFQQIALGVGMGVIKGAMTGDPAMIVLGGAMGGVGASGILAKPRAANGQLQLSPQEQQVVLAFNQQWAQLTTEEKLLVLAQKNAQQTQALFQLMTPDNRRSTQAAIAMFSRLKPDRQKQYILAAAQAFKAKQVALQQQQNQAVAQATGTPAPSPDDAVNTQWAGLNENVHIYLLLKKSPTERAQFVSKLSPQNQQNLAGELQRFEAKSKDEQNQITAQVEAQLKAQLAAQQGGQQQQQPPQQRRRRRR